MRLFPLLTRAYLACSLLILAGTSQADVVLPTVDSRYVSVKELNPSRDSGYVVGDKLERTLVITVKKPYELIAESLPIVGYEHRYRGQVSGIELAAIDVETEPHADSTTHTIHLVYQVFKSARVAKPALLRGEVVKLRHNAKKEIRQFQFQPFTFRVSPLSVYGEVNLKQEMSPFIKPFTLSTATDYRILNAAAVVLALSLLGLLYIFGAYSWLPRMGGAFAKAYRQVSKYPDTQQGLQEAVSAVHRAIQQVAGHSVFGNSVERFIEEKPAYAPAKPEIERFFGLSRQVFFDSKADPALGMPAKQWLKQFCRHMRDCERGLRPEVK